MSGKNLVYWDTCIFISWLGNETRVEAREMYGVADMGTAFDMNQIDVATSTVTITEILEAASDTSVYTRFRGLLSRRNLLLTDVDRSIAELASEIRSFYYIPNTPSLTVPDCIHLATAIRLECEKFYTFDGDDHKSNKLLTLPLPIANKYQLVIQRPISDNPTQLSLIP